MASNRNWPSMFKRSKPSNPHHNNTNSSLMSTGFQRTTPYTAVGDERNPEPKPRWNPKPEQIRILEGIFDSGMMNPPREEIRKICTQLQEYGKVGDANVFYWFQNRKSRTKHKVGRQLHKNKSHQNSPSPTALLPQITPPSSSSSSSDKSSPQQLINLPHNNYNDFSNINGDQLLPMLNSSPTPSVNQTYFQTHMNETTFQLPPPASESFPLIPLLQNINDQGAMAIADNANIATQGLYNLSDFSNMNQPQENVVPCNTMNINNLMHQDPQLDFGPSTDPVTVPSLTNQVQGVGEVAVGPFNVRGESIQVFINDELYEVAVGPFNVREAFGDGYVLFHSSGHPLLTDEWGFTLHSLQHAESYYLI